MPRYSCPECQGDYLCDECGSVTCPNCTGVTMIKQNSILADLGDPLPTTPPIPVFSDLPRESTSALIPLSTSISTSKSPPKYPILLDIGNYFSPIAPVSQDEEPNILDNPPRFAIPQGQDFLRLIYEGCRRHLSLLEYERLFSLFHMLYSKNMIDPSTKLKITCCPTQTKQHLQVFRDRLTLYIVQFTYYQRSFDDNGRDNLPRGLTRKELQEDGYKKMNIFQQIFNGKMICGICHRDIGLMEYGIKLECQHKFHFYCFNKWAQLCGICLVCNRDLTKNRMEEKESLLQQVSGDIEDVD